jgi:anti-anti-sigma factor
VRARAATSKGAHTEPVSEQPPRPLGPTSRFSISRAGGTVVVAIHGQISFEDWSRVDAVLRDLIDSQGNLDVVLDLCGVAYLQRDAVPLIVHAAHQAHSHGGRLRLADRACHDRQDADR